MKRTRTKVKVLDVSSLRRDVKGPETAETGGGSELRLRPLARAAGKSSLKRSESGRVVIPRSETCL